MLIENFRGIENSFSENLNKIMVVVDGLQIQLSYDTVNFKIKEKYKVTWLRLHLE